MRKVLHYKTNFLNNSETFINRLVKSHKTYSASALCYRKKFFTDDISVYEAPVRGAGYFINSIAFHLNLSLPFYKQIVSELKPDMIHGHFGFDSFKMLRIAVSQNIPLITSFYGSDVSRLPTENGWKGRYKQLAEKGAHFIAASDVMKSQLIKLGFPEHKISVVRFGLNLDELSYHKKTIDCSKIMMVGRLVEKKGFEYAIRAIAGLRKKGIKPEVNIFGDGPLMKSLKSLTVDLKVADQIFFHGYQPVDQILKAHHNHSILMAPSVTAADGDMEGLPNTILEAMAKGTIVIGTNHAAIPEVIQHGKTGFLANERDVNGLIEILQNLSEGHYDIEGIRNKARIIIENEYTIGRMVAKIESIYDHLEQRVLADSEIISLFQEVAIPVNK